MRMLSRSFSVAGLALCLCAGPLLAQESGGRNFRWSVGGHGGIMFFSTQDGDSDMPVAGGHVLIVAKRTGLLLSLDQGFGSDETSSYDFQVVDSLTNTVVNQGSVSTTFSGLRKASAMLVVFPVKNDYVNPYLGVGVGILHTTGNTPDNSATSALGSSGFGSLLGGLEFRVSRFTAFGQYQITTKTQLQGTRTSLGGGFYRNDFGRLTVDGTHTLTAGLRFDLGSAREAVKTGGYK